MQLGFKEIKKEIKEMNNRVFCVDLESSGLTGVPEDFPLSVAVSEVDLINQTVTPYFDEILGYDTSEWSQSRKESWIFDNSNMSMEDVQVAYDKGDTALNVANRFNELMKDKPIVIYNRDYDYSKFLKYKPFNLTSKQVLPCLMIAARDPASIPHRYFGLKFPTLIESVDIFLDKDIQSLLAKNEAYHDASFDVLATGYILLKLIEEGHYNIKKHLTEAQ